MRIVIQEESDLTIVTYNDSIAKAVVWEGSIPKFTITIERYSNYEIAWLNEELIQITNWPGRCVSIYTIYSTIEEMNIYEAGFNHCGV